jgi:hypothetical protein
MVEGGTEAVRSKIEEEEEETREKGFGGFPT